MTPSILRVSLAYVVDWYIVSLISTFPVYLLRYLHLGTWSLVNQTGDLPDGYIIAAVICAVVITLLYFVVLPLKPTGKREAGQTLGKRLFKIKTVRLDGTDIQLKESLKRNLYILILEGSLFPSILYIREAIDNMTAIDGTAFFNAYTAIALISISICFFNKQRRAGHDLFSKTKIVKCAAAAS
jgi:uncharacterized RDD family membrane protein YckC